MRRFKGKVKNGKIVLQSRARLPEGARVEVHVVTNRKKKREDTLKKRGEIVERILAHQIEGPVGMAEIIERRRDPG